MKNVLTSGALIIILMGLIFVLIEQNEMRAPDVTTTPAEEALAEPDGVAIDAQENQTESESEGSMQPDEVSIDTENASNSPSVGKLKADTFTGTLTKVDTGCFADGECYVEVDGKKVTAIIGFSIDEVGSVDGVAGFGDLEAYIGKRVEVYAQDNSDGTYTLYGSEGFYIRPL